MISFHVFLLAYLKSLILFISLDLSSYRGIGFGTERNIKIAKFTPSLNRCHPHQPNSIKLLLFKINIKRYMSLYKSLWTLFFLRSTARICPVLFFLIHKCPLTADVTISVIPSLSFIWKTTPHVLEPSLQSHLFYNIFPVHSFLCLPGIFPVFIHIITYYCKYLFDVISLFHSFPGFLPGNSNITSPCGKVMR